MTTRIASTEKTFQRRMLTSLRKNSYIPSFSFACFRCLQIKEYIISLILHLNAFLMPISTNKLWIRLFASLTVDKGNGTGV